MAKQAKSDRQAKIDAIRRQQKGAERARGFAIVGVCILIAVVIVAAAAWRPISGWLSSTKYDDLAVDEIGAEASVCQPVEKRDAEGNQAHVPTGTEVAYPYSPPAFGEHWNEFGVAPVAMDRKVYTDDRPDLEALVHNLEHGYTILWYDETIADDDDAMAEIRGIASKYAGTEDWRDKFIAAPWTSADEEEGDRAREQNAPAEGETEGADPSATATGEPSGKPTGKASGKASGDASDKASGGASSSASPSASASDDAEDTGFVDWPEGQHIAFTHWYADSSASNQQGVWQFCSEPSGAALEEFMTQFPYFDSPEPNAM